MGRERGEGWGTGKEGKVGERKKWRRRIAGDAQEEGKLRFCGRYDMISTSKERGSSNMAGNGLKLFFFVGETILVA